jgi:predicted nucleic acid-binding protein
VIYCDTSFLASLYVTVDVNHTAAIRAASRFVSAMPYPHLVELELVNALRRLLVAGKIAETALSAMLSQIERDVRDGFLERKVFNQSALYREALDISERRMALAARSLDILHVAAARVLGVRSFASFDARQRSLAKAEGLLLVPPRIT